MKKRRWIQSVLLTALVAAALFFASGQADGMFSEEERLMRSPDQTVTATSQAYPDPIQPTVTRRAGRAQPTPTEEPYPGPPYEIPTYTPAPTAIPWWEGPLPTPVPTQTSAP